MISLPSDPETLARLKKILEDRAFSKKWRCDLIACDGEPHEGKDKRHARPAQTPPWKDRMNEDGVMRKWYLRGGRGSGKTWAGSHSLAEIILWHGGKDNNGDQRQYGIVGPDFRHTLETCMEGPSGLIAALGGENGGYITNFNRATGDLHMENGAIVYISGADSFGRRIEGKNLTAVWADEIGLWSLRRWQRTWEQAIQFAVRKKPSLYIVTGTPKQGHPLVQRLVADKSVHTVVMSTKDNKSLDADQLLQWEEMYAGTRLGRQELEGEVLMDTPGALWSTAQIESSRLEVSPEELIRIFIGWDPAVTSGSRSDEHGMIVAGQLAGDPTRYCILEDGSGRYSPNEAVNKIGDLYEKWGADKVIAETNNGGDMIEALLRTGKTIISYSKVTATRGKRLRAEPIAALSEQGRLHMVGVHPKLEEQMTTWSPEQPGSPDRLDAMVWAITALQEKAATSRGYVGKHRISVRSK